MKKILCYSVFFLMLAIWALAQAGPQYVNVVTTAPSGSCTSTAPLTLASGALYTCQAGVWAQIQGSGGGPTPTFPVRSMPAYSACTLPAGGAPQTCTGTVTISGGGYTDANYGISGSGFSSAGAALVFTGVSKTATTVGYSLTCVANCTAYGTYFIDVITSHP